MPPTALYALSFGKKPVNPANHYYGMPTPPQNLYTQFYFWCILDDQKGPILVDQGCTEVTVREMGIAPCLSAHPLERLRGVGVAPEAVRHVILSHLHWDHYAGDDFFPNAVYWLHAREFAHVTGPLMRFATYSQHYWRPAIEKIRTLHAEGRCRLIDGESHSPVPGVECRRSGGHSPGLLSVVVQGRQGAKIICSDVAPRYDNLEKGIPCGIHYDVTEALTAVEQMGAETGSLPGHDPLLTERFPETAPGAYRIF